MSNILCAALKFRLITSYIHSKNCGNNRVQYMGWWWKKKGQSIATSTEITKQILLTKWTVKKSSNKVTFYISKGWDHSFHYWELIAWDRSHRRQHLSANMRTRPGGGAGWAKLQLPRVCTSVGWDAVRNRWGCSRAWHRQKSGPGQAWWGLLGQVGLGCSTHQFTWGDGIGAKLSKQMHPPLCVVAGAGDGPNMILQ